MQNRTDGTAQRRLLTSTAGLALCVGMLAAAPAHAAPADCSVAALNAKGVANMTFDMAKDVPATAKAPEYCETTGMVDMGGRKAGFRLKLPASWNHKLIFFGVGGTGGQTKSPSANAVDMGEALGKGYATVVTDTGHQSKSSTDGSFAITAVGVPNTAAIADYNYGATHAVNLAAKAFLKAYYSQGSVMRAYFEGCSGGGRQALNTAGHYPEDFDGIIAGDPGVGDKFLMTLKTAKSQFDPPEARIPKEMLPVIDKAVYAACDAVDGVKDGLIQNPAACHWTPQSLACKPGQTTGCLTTAQIQGFKNYLRPLTDRQGHVYYHGYYPTDVSGGVTNFNSYALGKTPADDPKAPEPWKNEADSARGWLLGDTQLKYFYAHDPSYNSQSFPINAAGVADAKAMQAYNRAIEDPKARDDDPRRLAAFLAGGRKLILYNGYSDPSTSPDEVIAYYRKLARLHGGYAKLQSQVQLYMVPGMQHCRGGAGPDAFDTLTAMENWVEKDQAPDSIVASKIVQGKTTRTMPLCKYPTEARYHGGNVDDAASWSCDARDHRLLGHS
ncbi:MAG TPA: tannase/feruloyl esterase family alpha/beta hydrolase [Stellaceae bacterium]|nr:tannase/feruloyl esterase family alpha/beta hydrolase [Stellaceae bacterium]